MMTPTSTSKGFAAAIAVLVLAAVALKFAGERNDSLNRDLAAFSPLRRERPPVKTRICLNMIVKDEEKDIIKFLNTVKDHITSYILCDTGSTDNTIRLAEEFFRSAGLNGTIEYHTFTNFAASRNLCLDAAVEKLGNECDFWLMLEPDHVFVSEGGVLLPSLDLSNLTSYYVEERNEGTVYSNRRLVSTKLRWYYVGAVHEYITVANDIIDGELVGILPQGIYAHHNIKFSVEKYEKYREMLESEVRAHPDEPRWRYYLAQTHAGLKNSDAAIMSYLARIQMGTLWVEEQYVSALNLANELAKIYDKPGSEVSYETQEALIPWVQMMSPRPTAENLLAVFFRAAYILPYRMEAWYYIAKIYRSAFSNYAKCYEYAKKAKESGPHTPQTIFSQGVIVDYYIDDELCICGYYVQPWSGMEACKRVITKINELKEPEDWQMDIKNRSMANMALYSAINTVRVPNDDNTTRVIFHSHQLGNRGTEVSIFDYGMWLEIFYNAEAHFAFPYPSWTPIMESPLKKFTTTFPGRVHLVFADNTDYPAYRKTLDDVVMAVGAQYLYRQELFFPLYEVSSLVPTLVHEVFNCSISRKMGAKYKAISPFVETQLGNGCTGNVPYMVWLPRCNASSNLRGELGISEDSFVFAWYGGHDAWDSVATEIIGRVAVARKNVVFLLQNFPPVEFLKIGHLSNVILVPSTSSMLHKCRFVQTADAFLHTRLLGETFGLAIAEFSLLGKPTITNINTPHRFHLETLRNNTFIYKTYGELEQTLMLLDKEKVLQFFPLQVNEKGESQNQLSRLYSEFSPCKVMKKFNEEFFDGKLVPRDNGAVLDKFCSFDNVDTQLIDTDELKMYGIHLF